MILGEYAVSPLRDLDRPELWDGAGKSGEQMAAAFADLFHHYADGETTPITWLKRHKEHRTRPGSLAQAQRNTTGSGT